VICVQAFGVQQKQIYSELPCWKCTKPVRLWDVERREQPVYTPGSLSTSPRTCRRVHERHETFGQRRWVSLVDNDLCQRRTAYDIWYLTVPPGPRNNKHYLGHVNNFDYDADDDDDDDDDDAKWVWTLKNESPETLKQDFFNRVAWPAL